jgi:hypothetical protein
MSSGVPKVRIVRVKNKPQNWAAYDVTTDTLLGYCGRDGVITNPVENTPINMPTEVVQTIDTRAPSQGVRRSFAAIAEGMGETPDRTSLPELSWKVVERKEIGFQVAGPSTPNAAGEHGYFHIVYEVTEARGEAVRTRVENGRACRMRREGFVAFFSLFSTYAGYARDHDKKLHIEKDGNCSRLAEPSIPKARRETEMDVLERELKEAQAKHWVAHGGAPKKDAPAVHTKKAKKVRR